VKKTGLLGSNIGYSKSPKIHHEYYNVTQQCKECIIGFLNQFKYPASEKDAGNKDIRKSISLLGTILLLGIRHKLVSNSFSF
jgi:hypothetical protein